MATETATPPAAATPPPTVHEPANNDVGNEFAKSLQAEFERQSGPSAGENGNHKVETETAPPPAKKDEPAKEPETKTEDADPLTELTTAPKTEDKKVEPAKEEADDTPESPPTDAKAAGTAWAKLRKKEKDAREEARQIREALTAKDKEIAELKTKATGDLAKENADLKEQLAARGKALAELDVTRSPEYEQGVTKPTTIIEHFFAQAAENAGTDAATLMEAVKEPDPFKRNKKIQDLLSDLTEADRMTAYRAAEEWQNVQTTKEEFHKNAEAYQSELKTRREAEAVKASEGYRTALAASQEKLIPALQRSIPVLGDDNVFRSVKEAVTTALGKNLTPDQIVGGMLSLHAMPAMKAELAKVRAELKTALEAIKSRENGEPGLAPGTREMTTDGPTDFMAGLAEAARKQGLRV